METIPAQQPERTLEDRKRVAEEIHTQISRTVQRLIHVEQLDISHSRVSELLDEQEIARRALAQFEAPEVSSQAA